MELLEPREGRKLGAEPARTGVGQGQFVETGGTVRMITDDHGLKTGRIVDVRRDADDLRGARENRAVCDLGNLGNGLSAAG